MYAISRDPSIYSNPASFDPDRYDSGEPLPMGHFGFGRRVCPGRFLADNGVWAMAVAMLHSLRFAKKVGPDGEIIEPRVVFTNGGTW
jgi:cytochrome P450